MVTDRTRDISPFRPPCTRARRAGRCARAPPLPREAERSPSATHADFVGAERCASCHATQYAVWERSTHGRAGGIPSAQTVIAPFGGGAIIFANARVTPRISGRAYDFVVE